MSSLRVVFRYLVEELRSVKNVASVRVLDQGAFVVDVARPNFHEEIAVYLVAGELSVGFIKKMLNANTQRDMYTMFIVALDLITGDGITVQMSDALRLLLQAYGGKIYAFQLVGQGAKVFPVYIDRQRRLRMGESVNLAHLGGDYAAFDNKYLLGVRKVATFTAREYHAYTPPPPQDDPLQPFYDLLGVPNTASETDVKAAYRRKARQHHPDIDDSPDATERMQAINEAYAKVMERYE